MKAYSCQVFFKSIYSHSILGKPFPMTMTMMTSAMIMKVFEGSAWWWSGGDDLKHSFPWIDTYLLIPILYPPPPPTNYFTSSLIHQGP